MVMAVAASAASTPFAASIASDMAVASGLRDDFMDSNSSWDWTER